MNGPCGSGKSTSLKLLAQEYNVQVVDLPVTSQFTDQDHSVENDFKNLSLKKQSEMDLCRFQSEWDGVRPVFSDTQRNRFRTFVYRFNTYRTSNLVLDSGESCNVHKLLLIEDLPNIFHLKPELLHQELALLVKTFGSSLLPMVFIISDCFAQSERNSSLTLEQKLLPKSIQIKHNFQTITFKPITQASMVKVLVKNPIGCKLSKAVIEDICTASNGDIRNALNFLLFAHSGGKNSSLIKQNLSVKKMKLEASMQSKSSSKSTVSVLKNEKTSSLSLLHGVAKILYAKRNKVQDPSMLQFIRDNPDFDVRFLRNPLVESDAGSILVRAHLNCDTLLEWLHENYLDFVADNDLEACLACAQLQSDSLILANDFEGRETIEEARSLLLALGTMSQLNKASDAYSKLQGANFHRGPAKQAHTFRPLKAPKSYFIYRESLENKSALTAVRQSIADQFNDPLFCFLDDSSLVLDMLPFMSPSTTPDLFQNKQDAERRALWSLLDPLVNFSFSGPREYSPMKKRLKPSGDYPSSSSNASASQESKTSTNSTSVATWNLDDDFDDSYMEDNYDVDESSD